MEEILLKNFLGSKLLFYSISLQFRLITTQIIKIYILTRSTFHVMIQIQVQRN